MHVLGRRIIAFMLAITVVATGTPELAGAFTADFFAKNTSGQAVYEDMAIKPQAVHMDGVTYIAYQGWLNDPYVIGYDHGSRSWDGPHKVGENPLNTSWNPLNTHGAPALYADRATGHLYVFWGAHGGALRHARTQTPRRIEQWRSLGGAASGVTYPQVISYETAQGPTVELLYRTATDPTRGWASKVTTGTADTLRTTPSTPVLEGANPDGYSPGWGWYATFEADAHGRVHMAAVSQPVVPGQVRPFVRHDVYYAYRDPGESRWRDVTGASIGTTESPVPSMANMRNSGLKTQVFSDGSTYQNQVSIAVDSDGKPAILFLSGKEGAVGKDSHEWMFARWDEGRDRWDVRSIAKTDHFMDSAAVDFPRAEDPMYVEAFLVIDGTKGAGNDEPFRRYEDRGGDIWQYVSYDGGNTWPDRRVLGEADADRGVIYNDPQIVRTDDPASSGKARLLYCQWDNNADNFINKVFLWGEIEEWAQKEFSPEMKRLFGASRVETAVSVSQESFPLGPPTVPPLEAPSRRVFIATGENYADALSGVPLAYAYRAPMLFVVGDALSPAVRAELSRLRGTHRGVRALDVVILGGPAAVSPTIETALRTHPDTRSVRRIDGHDRYEVSRKVALELASVVGRPAGAFVASGENFPDALAAAPVAAAKGYPILLTTGDRLNGHTRSVMSYYGVKSAIVVGGPNTIKPEVVTEIGKTIKGTPNRVFGSDRYATAAAVGEMGLFGVDGDLGVLSMDRFVVASGENFPDALSGGLLAARVRGPVVLTQGATLPAPARGFLQKHAYEVLDAYIVGGPAAISPTVFHQVGALVEQRKDEQRHPH